jgi:flagellar basal-body rod protein FlgB
MPTTHLRLMLARALIKGRQAMFIDRLLNQGSGPLLEQTIRFTAARHQLIAENVVNISTPGYQQKDLSLEKFQQMLADRAARAENAAPGSVRFDDISMDADSLHRGVLFHDGQTRSMEMLMSDQAKNALMHNLAIELLRRQFQTMEMAIKLQP